jgi:hypothetical protein
MGLRNDQYPPKKTVVFVPLEGEGKNEGWTQTQQIRQ